MFLPLWFKNDIYIFVCLHFLEIKMKKIILLLTFWSGADREVGDATPSALFFSTLLLQSLQTPSFLAPVYTVRELQNAEANDGV